MKFMLILKSTKDSEAGKMPSEESIAAMVKYNQEQAKAGILVDAAGLYPSSKNGARIRFATGGKKTVYDRLRLADVLRVEHADDGHDGEQPDAQADHRRGNVVEEVGDP